jgi:hypothetical protein
MTLTLPCVRFVRCYDPHEYRMLNVWMWITTLEQLRNPPLAVELAATAQTAEECMAEIRKYESRFYDMETLDKIEKASKQLVEAKPSFYGVRNA